MTHCRQKASRCILIRQRRGLQLIDITVILWSTFFFPCFFPPALHCSVRVHRRLVDFFPAQRREGGHGWYLEKWFRGNKTPWTPLELTVFFLSSLFVYLFLLLYFWRNGAAALGKIVFYILYKLSVFIIILVSAAHFQANVISLPSPCMRMQQLLPRTVESHGKKKKRQRASVQWITRLCWDVGSSFLNFYRAHFKYPDYANLLMRVTGSFYTHLFTQLPQ